MSRREFAVRYVGALVSAFAGYFVYEWLVPPPHQGIAAVGAAASYVLPIFAWSARR